MAQILVVDDSNTMREIVSTFLKQNGFEVALANDGRDGLRQLRQDADIKLVVSDINMPNMDGLTMAEKIRTELGNSSGRIVMLTTEDNATMRARHGDRHHGLDRQALQGRCRAGAVSALLRPVATRQAWPPARDKSAERRRSA
jgi:two-component system chemotaxis response regulator CheY